MLHLFQLILQEESLVEEVEDYKHYEKKMIMDDYFYFFYWIYYLELLKLFEN